MGKLLGKALPHQYKYIYTKSKYTALVSGLGAGKTEALIYRLLYFISNVRNAEVACYQPTIELTKAILYPRLEEIFGSTTLKWKLNKSDGLMEIWFVHGKATIRFKSMENYSRIIGYQSMLSLIDEIDTLPADKAKQVWIRIMARNRKKFKYLDGTLGVNQIGVTTTPEGFGFMYQMWVKEHGDNPDYELIRGRTVDNHHLPPDYVDSLRRTYPPQLIEAYLEGKFVNLKGNTVYATFDRVSSHTHLTIDDFPEGNMLHVGMDFNIGRTAAIIIMKSDEGQLYIIDEIHHSMDTPSVIIALQSKFPDRLITVYPDASGSSRKSIDSSKSDHKLLRNAGFRIKARRKNPPVRERVVNVQTAFLNAKGERNLFVNTSVCSNLTEQLEKQVFDENSVPEKNGEEDPLDALGYAIMNMKSLARGDAKVARMKFGSW